MKYKIGDDIEFLSSEFSRDGTDGITVDDVRHGKIPRVGGMGRVVKIINSHYMVEYQQEERTMILGFKEQNIKLIKSNNMSSEKINPVVAANLDINTQVLVQAGYLNSYLTLTDKGQDALTAMLYTQNKDALVAQAKTELADATK